MAPHTIEAAFVPLSSRHKDFSNGVYGFSHWHSAIRVMKRMKYKTGKSPFAKKTKPNFYQHKRCGIINAKLFLKNCQRFKFEEERFHGSPHCWP